jgi:hypothetical protein
MTDLPALVKMPPGVLRPVISPGVDLTQMTVRGPDASYACHKGGRAAHSADVALISVNDRPWTELTAARR